MADLLGLEEEISLSSGHAWVEERLFEVLGSWVASTTDLGAKLALDRHSMHCAWRAARWRERLGAEPAAPPFAGALIGGLLCLEGDLPRLAGAYRVALPRLVSRYGAHRARAGAVSDAPAVRTLGLVTPDAVADWAEGEAILEGLVVGTGEVAAAAKAVAGLEELLVGRVS